jgi:hypothetical protein
MLIMVHEIRAFAPLFFEITDGSVKYHFPYSLYFTLWNITGLMLLAGLFTRVTSVVNYVFIVVTAAFLSNGKIGSFNDDLLRIGGFLMMIMPVSRSLSLDALRERMFSNSPVSRTTSFHNYLVALFVSLGLLYFGSGYTKTYSPVWLDGLGLWLPSVIPFHHWNKLHLLFTDNYYLCATASWVVVAFELLFPFLIFSRRWHLPIAIFGVGMHILIAVEFCFPAVAIGPISFYALMLNNRFWVRVDQQLRVNEQTLVTFDPQNLRHVILVRLIKAFDNRRRFQFAHLPGLLTLEGRASADWKVAIALTNRIVILKPLAFLLQSHLIRILVDYAATELFHPRSWDQPARRPFLSYASKQFYLGCFVILLVILQAASLAYHTYSHIAYDEKKRSEKRMKSRGITDLTARPSQFGRTLFGINSRGLFLDHSYAGKQNMYGITIVRRDGSELWLPYFNDDGLCLSWNLNVHWARYTFTGVSYGTRPANVKELEKETAFWAGERGVRLDSVHMNVYRKTITFPSKFEQGMARKLMSQPWEKEGEITWYKGEFHYRSLRPDSTSRVSAGLPSGDQQEPARPR